jgi:hypothetical protein
MIYFMVYILFQGTTNYKYHVEEPADTGTH